MVEHENVRLREFRPMDLPAVQKLILKTTDVSYAKTYPPSAIDHFKEHHTDEKILGDAKEGYMVVLECDGRIVGTGTLIDGKITRVYVKPADQGYGLGSRIMNLLEQHARGEGLESVFIYSSVVAKRFYESLGYCIEARKSAEMEDGGQLEYFEMVKYLRDNLAGLNG